VSCSVHDAIALEKQGIPTVTVCTDGFLAGGRMQADSLGMRQYPFLCVPQRYITGTPQEVRALADASLEEVLKRLLVVD
jgi:hypothetical protein